MLKSGPENLQIFFGIVSLLVLSAVAWHLHSVEELVLQAKGGGFTTFRGTSLGHLRFAIDAVLGTGVLGISYCAITRSRRWGLGMYILFFLVLAFAVYHLQAALRGSQHL